jgi:hypothetical protein
MVTLKNNTNRRQIFECPHDFVCTEGECLCTVLQQRSRAHNPETGEVGTRSEEVKAPFAVHLSARGTSQSLPDGVLQVPAVAEAIRRGLITAD